MIGRTIAHFHILQDAGSGGMGQVYRALDTRNGREVALKILPKERIRDDETRTRFLHEARAQELVSHPNVAAFYEAGDSDGVTYIAMEFIPGPTLADYATHTELSLEESLDLTIKIGEGLKAAHEKGVVHRDLKPGNIMISEDGQPKITDFGLARYKGATTITKTGRVVGTARYMSPEQAEGRRVDQRSDVFSLGILLYELVCRQVPFKGDTDAAVLYELLTKPAQPMSRYSREVPDELEEITQKALAKNPEDRYQSVAEFITDLNQVRSSTTGQKARRVRWILGGRRFRRRIAVFSIAAVALAAIVFFGGKEIKKRIVGPRLGGLVVLPFRNVGAPEQEYFTDGVTDEITTRLAAIPELRVISRTSAIHYRDSDKPIGAIARELKVDFVLEGAVRWDDSGSAARMHVTPQLIRVKGEQQIWAETFDHRLEGVLLTQAQIAEAVTKAIGAHLGRELRLPEQPLTTTNVEAYNFYLRGSDYLNRGFDRADLEIAMTQFGQAIALDSNFAAAHARLSRAQSKYYWFHEEGDSTRLEIARREAQTALRLAPKSPEAHLALGYCLYWGDRDFEGGLDQFEQVRNLEPSNADAYFAVGGILRRLGRFEEAVSSFRQAADLDVLSADRAFEVGNTYYHMRRCTEADSFFNHAIALAPDKFPAYSRKALNYIHCDGSTVRARLFVDSSLGRFGPGVFRYHLYALDCLDGRYDSALSRLSLAEMDSARYFSLSGRAHQLAGQAKAAKADFQNASKIMEQRLKRAPLDPDLLSELGIVYTGLDRFDEAVDLAERAVALRPIGKDAFGGPYLVEQLAEVQMRAGHEDSAVVQLAILLAANNPLSKRTLLFDPLWEPLRTNPNFQKLVK